MDFFNESKKPKPFKINFVQIVSGFVIFFVLSIGITIAWPKIEAMQAAWKLEQERQEKINGCGLNPEMENARAVFCD